MKFPCGWLQPQRRFLLYRFYLCWLLLLPVGPFLLLMDGGTPIDLVCSSVNI